MRREARNAGDYYVPAEPKLAFVVRFVAMGLAYLILN